jgi:2',3'-cyclic-nucleotide 2'-phosphodiesterase (5'-nucleotidase family)
LGGVARRATRIAQERNKGGAVLLLDAGDSLVGDQDPARKTQGQTSVAAMNLLGYDAMALGPQDLALGPAVLQQRMAEARFAFLSANAVVSATGKLAATPFVIRELGGHKVALVGLSGGNGTSEIAVRDPVETAKSVVVQVKGQADVVILLSHAGASVDRQIADAVPGIALIVSGGPLVMPAPWRSEKTGTLVVHADEAQPGHAGRVMGVATLAFDPRGELVKQDWQSVALVDSIPDDPAMATWVQQQSSR